MDDTSTAPSEGTSSPVTGSMPSDMFPVLSSSQQARVLAHGRCRNVEQSEIVVLETSLPGVFADGDIRGGNLKRVASAVREGSIAVSFVHQVLTE